MIVVTPISPLSGATSVATGTSISFTVADLPNVVRASIQVVVNGQAAIIAGVAQAGFTASTIVPGSVNNPSYTVTIVPNDHLPGLTVVPVAVTAVNTIAQLSTGSYSFTTSVRPDISAINAVIGDPFGRNIRIYFSEGMLNNSALSNTANYTLTGTTAPAPFIPTITSIVPQVALAPTYVDVKLSAPMTNNGGYKITVTNSSIFSAGTGNKLGASPDNEFDFFGFGPVSTVFLIKDTLVTAPIIEGPSLVSFGPVKAALAYPNGLGSLTFTAKFGGINGNSITVFLQDPGVPNASLSVTTTTTSLTVSLKTNSSSVITSTLAEVVASVTAINSIPVDLVSAGNSNAIVIPMVAPSALTGGASQDIAANYNILSPTLDIDVISIAPGPSSLGIVTISNFVNNADGTGSFRATFSNLLTNYRLSIIAMDNVDNQSLESNVLSISVLPETLPGTDLVIYPKTSIYSEVCDSLISNIPESLFILKDGFVIPYTKEPYPFTLEVVDIGNPVIITITREVRETNTFNTDRISFIPQALKETINLPMTRGRNYISVSDTVRRYDIIVSATEYASVLCSISQEMFNYSNSIVDEIDQSLFNTFTTKLAEPYLSLFEVLPSVRPQQLLATKLIIRSYVTDAGKEKAVIDLLTGITLQTPPSNPNLAEREFFEPAIYPLFNQNEAFSGSDLHIWLHNFCASRWVAFTKYLNNLPHIFKLVSVDDGEVIFYDDNNKLSRHQFNLLDPACSTFDLSTFCLENIFVNFSSVIRSNLTLCAASYPFDMCYDGAHPLGANRVMFDVGLTWDTGTPFDEDALDPGNDGWIGFCFTPHFDSEPVPDAVPPQPNDIILGDATGFNTDDIYGVNSMYDMYLNEGDTVYFKNQNIPYLVDTITNSNTLLLDATTEIERPLIKESGRNAILGVPSGGILPLTDLFHTYLSGTGNSITVGGLFTTALPTFTSYDVGSIIYIGGLNNRTASIVAVVGAEPSTQVQLDSSPAWTAEVSAFAWNVSNYLSRVGFGGDITNTGVLTVNWDAFSSADVGKKVTIQGATNPTNNQTATILGLAGLDSVQLDSTGWVNETGVFEWYVNTSGEFIILHTNNTFTASALNAAVLNYDGILTTVASIFTTTSVGKTVTISGSPNTNNNGSWIVDEYISSTKIRLSKITDAGVGASISALGVLTASSAIFTANDVGKTVKVSHCTNTANNRTTTISVYTSSTQVTLAGVGYVAETSPFKWTMFPFIVNTNNFTYAFGPTNNDGFFLIEDHNDLTEASIYHSTAYNPDPSSTNIRWYRNKAGILKKLSGIPLDSSYVVPSDVYLGKVYILPDLISPPETSSTVTGITTEFTEDLEVGDTVYFDDSATTYQITTINSDTEVEISAPRTLVDPTVSGVNTASITSVGVFTAPNPIFFATDIGKPLTISGAVNPTNNKTAIIIAVIGSLPSAQVQLDNLPYVDEANSFSWSVLTSSPAPLSFFKAALPVCVYENGYVTTVAALTSADEELDGQGDPGAAFEITRTGATTLTVGGTNVITVASAIFLASDVGNTFEITIAANPANIQTVTVSAYISPTTIEISGAGFVNEINTFTWVMTVT